MSNNLLTADQGCLWMFGCRSKSVAVGLAYTAYRLYARSVCYTKSAAAAAVCGLWRYMCYAFTFTLLLYDK